MSERHPLPRASTENSDTSDSFFFFPWQGGCFSEFEKVNRSRGETAQGDRGVRVSYEIITVVRQDTAHSSGRTHRHTFTPTHLIS